MLTLWGRDTSFNVQKVIWALLELDIAFTRIDAGTVHGRLDTPEFGALNPNRRIPVLVDGDTVLWESNTIIRYIAAKWGQGQLWPENPAIRAQADMWMDWQQTVFQSAFQPVFYESVVLPQARRDPDRLARHLRLAGEAALVLETWLRDRDYIAGAAFSMGDIPIGTAIFRYFDLPLDRPALPRLEAYFDRLRARQPYRNSAMMSYEPLRARE